ncbi:MAG TPA: HNH endonuclease [Candidatus Acidoferrales bacterium]|nr:HNH endonuclease [Candidatus Acidoferrales bacterium]
MTHPSPILLTKLANDAGFAGELGEADGWLAFAVPGRDLELWLRGQDEALVAALSRGDVLAELPLGAPWSGPLPSGAAGARQVASASELLTLLHRARVLERTLPDALLVEYQRAAADIDRTEAEALVRQRRGQALFRQGLLDYWGGRCAISGLDVPQLLRASHAKPWKDATDAERLDVHNGLLLAAHLDAAFDQGFIAFDATGRIEISPALPASAVAILGLNPSLRLTRLSAAHAPYLAWHRAHVFRGGDVPEVAQDP